MARKKVKLAYISNDSARKATFKKRKRGLVKKVSELSTLCGIQACAIIYSPYESQPEVWPSPVGVHRVLSEFKKRSEMDQSKKMMNQDSYLRQRIGKTSEQLKKQLKDNREKEMTEVMFRNLVGKLGLQHLNLIDLNDLGWLIDQHLKNIINRIVMVTNNAFVPHGPAAATTTMDAPALAPAAAPASALAAAGEMALGVDANLDVMQRNQWILEMMNPQDHRTGFVGDEMMLPFGDNDNNNNINNINNNNAFSWSNAFFP